MPNQLDLRLTLNQLDFRPVLTWLDLQSNQPNSTFGPHLPDLTFASSQFILNLSRGEINLTFNLGWLYWPFSPIQLNWAFSQGWLDRALSLRQLSSTFVNGMRLEWEGLESQISYTFDGIWNFSILLIWNTFQNSLYLNFFIIYFIQTNHFSVKYSKFFK